MLDRLVYKNSMKVRFEPTRNITAYDSWNLSTAVFIFTLQMLLETTNNDSIRFDVRDKSQHVTCIRENEQMNIQQ